LNRSAQIAAQEASADGINWTFSPMVDVSRDPRWEEFLKVLVKMLRKPNCKSNGKGINKMICQKQFDFILRETFCFVRCLRAGRDYNTVDMSRIKCTMIIFLPIKQLSMQVQVQ
jgi:beta-glucosidase